MAAVAAQSNDGKSAAEKLKGFQDSEVSELQDKQKTLQAAQQKLESGGSVLSEAARTQLQTDIDRQQRDLQRLSEDAQQDVQNLASRSRKTSRRKVLPIISKVAAGQAGALRVQRPASGLIWAEPGMDPDRRSHRRHEWRQTAAAPTPPRPKAK
jgi:Skp family chaperone for outer membrane proteins